MLGRKQIVEMLNQLLGSNIDWEAEDEFVDSVIAFATKVASAEREECAALCDSVCSQCASIIRKGRK